MKMNWKEFAILKCMSMLEGNLVTETTGMIDNKKDLEVDLFWEDDFFKTNNGYYYMSFDKANDNAIKVEWRGHTDKETREIKKLLVCTISSEGYTHDIVKTIFRAIKKHKRYFEDNDL